MRNLLTLAVWLCLVGGAWYALGPMYGAIYLAVGILMDRICEKQAKKKGEHYSAATQLCAYVFGPVMVPFALAFALVKAFAHMVKH
ncbi:hypothetical protein RCRUDOLPH_39 [Rhodobacter phage RcRudolph]|nr:hypothetical protein RCRUDOLPH_39 [Rhodobacter phage RcRudolph]